MSESVYVPVKLNIEPGITRDGTNFSLTKCLDMEWARFHAGYVRKMGGMRRIGESFPGVSRYLWSEDVNGFSYFHSFNDDGIYQISLEQSSGVPSPVYTRTPVGFTASSAASWTVHQMYDAGGANSLIIAHRANNTNFIDSNTGGTLYSGSPNGTGVFTTPTITNGPTSVSGGVVVSHPYLFYFGQDGYITHSAPNTPFDCTIASGGGGVAGYRVAESKIIQGAAFRGGQTGPAALFWSLNSLIRASFVGGATQWSFTTIADWTTILSQHCIVENDGVFYWPGVDRFMMFNGVVQELPNEDNLRYFYEGLNFDHRGKCYGFRVPAWGEIWWVYPRYPNTEPSHAIIFNTRKRIWYDTVLPNNTFRTSGTSAQTFPYPMMCSYDPVLDESTLWQHEFGKNIVDGNRVLALRSSITTPYTSMPHAAAKNKYTKLVSFEPDTHQVGDLNITVMGRVTSNSPIQVGETQVCSPETDQVRFNEEHRLLQFKIESNVEDGDYILGENLMHITTGTGRDTV